jgi:2,3-bisphosphoglycerate-independent phosphoglycerate mutase
LVKKPLMLMILDGWGDREQLNNNAIRMAHAPYISSLLLRYPHTCLEASGEDVGLPEGQIGNSEVGHLNLGAGRVVYQDLTRITKAIREGNFYKNKQILDAYKRAKQTGAALHLLGLLSDGGVHSHIEHLFALLELAKQEQLSEVYVHSFLDGRDVPPSCSLAYCRTLDDKLNELPFGVMATVMGRYYAMDRDNRWDRVELAYRAMVYGEGLKAETYKEAVENAYAREETDEFVLPTVIVDKQGEPYGKIKDGDVLIFFNFRPDRARQITRAFVEESFTGFDRGSKPPKVYFVSLTQYDENIEIPIAFQPEHPSRTLGEIISKHGLTQLRIAETEKYAHVTFFFSGGEENPFPGEDRVLVPSPKVATYDLQPEMSAFEVARQAVAQVKSGKYDFIVLNFANADMVGHTGDLKAAIKAIEAVDRCVEQVVETVREVGGLVVITADHGNAEQMVDPETGEEQTAHTTNKVPLIIVDDDLIGVELQSGKLADVAPTILELLNLPKPEEMTGNSLLQRR